MIQQYLKQSQIINTRVNTAIISQDNFHVPHVYMHTSNIKRHFTVQIITVIIITTVQIITGNASFLLGPKPLSEVLFRKQILPS